MLTVTVRKVKRPSNGGGSWLAYLLGEDQHGLWLHCPAGSVHHLVAGGTWTAPWPGVQLLPRDGWWVAWWWDDPDGRWVGVDVCTPPRLARGTWTYEDLELDPVGNEAGFVRLVDEDEFEEARAKGWISSDEVDAALQATTEIETMMRTRVEPFGTLAWQRLQEAVDLSLPPLVAAPGRVLADPGAQH